MTKTQLKLGTPHRRRAGIPLTIDDWLIQAVVGHNSTGSALTVLSEIQDQRDARLMSDRMRRRATQP